MDYQDELTEKRRNALWRALPKGKRLNDHPHYPTPQETRWTKRRAFWIEFVLGVIAGAALLGLTILAMFAL
jgi:uncharacterized membrane protein YoaK (UPF0700 family)